jgi:hypothetical protein
MPYDWERFKAGLIAQRPAPSLLGREYFATDTTTLYIDTGLSWEDVSSLGISNPYDPRNFGGFGNGIADDTAAVVNALAAAPIGAIVPIVQGLNYRLTSPVTVTSRIVAGDGTLSGGGLAALVSLSGSNPRCVGLGLVNPGGGKAVDIAQNCNGARVKECVISGAALQQGVGANATGVKHLRVVGCTFDSIGYGVLTDSAANDITDVRVIDNTFIGLTADPVEFNHPTSAGGTGLVHAVVSGNHFYNTAGSGSSAGFGVGIANGHDVTITGNTFRECRNEGIHIEDHSTEVTITGNTIHNGASHGMNIIGVTNATVTGNTVVGCAGTGIRFDYSPSTTNDHYTVTGNVTRGNGNGGISVGSDSAKNVTITGNVSTDNTGFGISLVTSNGGSASAVICRDNIANNNTTYGIIAITHPNSIVGPNIATGNGTANYARNTGTTTQIRQTFRDLMGQATGVANTGANTDTAWAPMFPLGDRAKGELAVTVRQTSAASFVNAIYDFLWDGTTLTTTLVGTKLISGGIDISGLRANAGNLEIKGFLVANSSADIYAELSGVTFL